MDDFIKTKDGTLIIGEPGYGKEFCPSVSRGQPSGGRI